MEPETVATTEGTGERERERPCPPGPAPLAPHHSGCATVKRRCSRMLWFTSSFLKSPGEPRGEPRGDPGAAAGAAGPCMARARRGWTDGARDAGTLGASRGAGPGEGAEGPPRLALEAP